MTCTSTGAKPASRSRFAIALDARVVLPLEPVVLMLISCSKMSRARVSFGASVRGACACRGTVKPIDSASRQARFISLSVVVKAEIPSMRAAAPQLHLRDDEAECRPSTRRHGAFEPGPGFGRVTLHQIPVADAVAQRRYLDVARVGGREHRIG